MTVRARQPGIGPCASCAICASRQGVMARPQLAQVAQLARQPSCQHVRPHADASRPLNRSHKPVNNLMNLLSTMPDDLRRKVERSLANGWPLVLNLPDGGQLPLGPDDLPSDRRDAVRAEIEAERHQRSLQ